MSDRTYVPVDVLRRAAEVLLAHVEQAEGCEVALEKDYYWAIVPEQVHDVYSKPRDFTIGQLTECLANIESMVDDPDSSVSYALVWLADVLRAVGQSLVR